ncbi:hypothetical protein H4W33_002099 [Kibdelosporangium phytohabitans]|nr:hypothetical protein [Kibdelosporangium phytohabitans]
MVVRGDVVGERVLPTRSAHEAHARTGPSSPDIKPGGTLVHHLTTLASSLTARPALLLVQGQQRCTARRDHPARHQVAFYMPQHAAILSRLALSTAYRAAATLGPDDRFRPVRAQTELTSPGPGSHFQPAHAQTQPVSPKPDSHFHPAHTQTHPTRPRAPVPRPRGAAVVEAADRLDAGDLCPPSPLSPCRYWFLAVDAGKLAAHRQGTRRPRLVSRGPGLSSNQAWPLVWIRSRGGESSIEWHGPSDRSFRGCPSPPNRRRGAGTEIPAICPGDRLDPVAGQQDQCPAEHNRSAPHRTGAARRRARRFCPLPG